MRVIIGCILSIVLFGGCKKEAKETNAIVGKWQSLGNSWFLDIAGDSTYVEYDVTDICCLVARDSHIAEFGYRLYFENDTLKLLCGAIEYCFIRSKSLPRACSEFLDEETAKDPVFNFEVFAKTVEDNYAFFELNNVNWDSLYSDQKKQIKASPSNLSLYKAMETIYEAVNDNHGSFEASAAVYEELEALEAENEEKTETLLEIGDFQVARAVAKHHLEDEMTHNSSIVQWGRFSDNIGYVQVKAMFLLTDMGMSKKLINTLGWEAAWQQTFYEMGEGNYIEEERKGMAQIMKMVMEDLKDMDAIIIDLRFNGGGQDLVSLELLRWFNDKPRVIANQSLVYESEESPTWDVILPASKSPFTKQVYLLTSQQTGSAAEVCAMASMVLPHLTRIGMPTMGALSTALEKKLPNGWDFALSNEYYRTPEGKIYENIGIPVDFEIPYPEDRLVFFRSVLDNLESDKQSILEAIRSIKKN